MKALFATVLIAGSLITTAPKAQAAEVVGIVVGGMVSTMVVVAIPLAIHGGLKTELYQEAVDVLATGDASFMSQELNDLVSSIKESNPALSTIDELTILDAVVNGESL